MEQTVTTQKTAASKDAMTQDFNSAAIVHVTGGNVMFDSFIGGNISLIGNATYINGREIVTAQPGPVK